MATESDFIQAIGLMSTLKPDMEVNINDPVGMAQAVAAEVKALRAERDSLAEQLTGKHLAKCGQPVDSNPMDPERSMTDA